MDLSGEGKLFNSHGKKNFKVIKIIIKLNLKQDLLKVVGASNYWLTNLYYQNGLQNQLIITVNIPTIIKYEQVIVLSFIQM